MKKKTLNPHVSHVYWIGFPSMDESVPQARQRQGQGQGLLLYRLQAEAADFIKRKSVDCGGSRRL